MKEKIKKIDWGKELRASNVIREIESYLDTYWDAEYVIFKIQKSIAKWRGKEIEEIMERELEK